MSRLTIHGVADVHFGGLQGFSLNGLEHNFVVVSGRNESGKSTLAEFIAWLIAGPAGKAADAMRYGDRETVVRGRLLGTLSGDELDLAGSFKILASGAPSDVPGKGQQAPRRGTLGAVGIDGELLLARFGGLTPAAYGLLYRIGSETAHLLDSESGLVDLFARYATGSISSSVDPRAAIDEIKKELGPIKTRLSALAGNSGRRADVLGQLTNALARPGRIRDIDSDIANLEEDRQAVDKAISAEAERIGDHRTAIGVFDRNEVARVAETDLRNSEDLPGDVALIADDLDSILDLAKRLEAARTKVIENEPTVASLCRSVGLDVAELAEHNLTNADKELFRNAAQTLIGRKQTLVAAESVYATHLDELRDAQGHAETCLDQGDLDREVLLRRVLDVEKVAALSNPAYAVDQALREVVRCERAVDGARLGRAPENEESQQSASGATWLLFLPALLGVIGAVIGGFVNPGVSAGAGIAGFVVGALVARSRSGGVASSISSTIGVGADPVAIASGELARARHDLRGKLDIVNTALNGLGLPQVTAEGACTYVDDLERALTALDKVRGLESLTTGLQEAVRSAAALVSEAEKAYSELFEQRGSPMIPESGISSWLDEYLDAIIQAKAHVGHIEDCSGLEAELADKTRGVDRFNDGSSMSVIIDRANHFISIRDTRAQLERNASDRRNEADIAMGQRPEVRDLLESGNKEKLEADLTSIEATIAGLSAQRTAIDSNLGALRSALAQESKGELIADLKEELGRIDDEIDELVREYVVFTAALESIEKVVGEYELRNQGPVIDVAQRLISSVDPNFGSIYVDRSTGAPQLMVDRSGRRLLVRRLSTGARALVYFALRLAFQTIDSQGRAVALPLICDDPLVTVDDARVEPIMRLLQQVSDERQVIFLTCHDREATIASRIGARIITL